MNKIKKKLLGLICLLSIGVGLLSPIQSNAYSSINVLVSTNNKTTQTINVKANTNYHVVNTNVLNVRMTPSTKYAPIKQLTKGAKVRIIKFNGDWVQIETIHKHNSHYESKGYNGKTGQMWVKREYLTPGKTPIYLIHYKDAEFICLD